MFIKGKPSKSGNYLVKYRGHICRDDYTTTGGGHWWNVGTKDTQDEIEYDPTSFRELGL